MDDPPGGKVEGEKKKRLQHGAVGKYGNPKTDLRSGRNEERVLSATQQEEPQKKKEKKKFILQEM